MGANAAVKAYRVMENLERILAIELYNAAQALEFRRPSRSSSFLEQFVSAYRKVVQFIDDDQVMFTDINRSVDFLREVSLEGLPDDELL